jgi:hypothetical protein
MKTFLEFTLQERFTYDVFQKGNRGLKKLDSLNQDELDDWMNKSRGKYATIVVKRSDGVTVTYDDDGKNWKTVSKEKT